MASVLDDSYPYWLPAMDRTMKIKTDFHSRFCIDQNRHSRSMLTKPSAWTNCLAFRNPLPVTGVGDCPPSGEADEAVLYVWRSTERRFWHLLESVLCLVKAEVLAFGFMYGCKTGLAHSSHEPRRHHGRHDYHRFRRSLLCQSPSFVLMWFCDCLCPVSQQPHRRTPQITQRPAPSATAKSKKKTYVPFGPGRQREPTEAKERNVYR